MTTPTMDELLQEAEELQKQEAPELYGEEGDAGISGEEGITGDDPAPVESAPEVESEVEKAPEVESEAEIDYKAEFAKIKAERDKIVQNDNLVQSRLKTSAEENRALKERLAEINQEIAALKAATPKETKVETPEITEAQLIEDLGETAGKLVYALNQKNALLEKRLGEVTNDIGSVKSFAVKSSEKEFFGKLLMDVPDWKEIYADPDFPTFLQTKAPYSRKTYMENLQEAASSFDAETTSEIYKAYKAQKTPVTQSVDVPISPKKDKEKLLEPNTSGKTQRVEAPPEILTEKDIKKTMDDILTLTNKGQYDQAKKLQAKLDKFMDSLG